MSDAFDILRAVLVGYADDDKWVGAPFENIKRISNTKVGSVGQEFVERLCDEVGFAIEFPTGAGGKRSPTSPWDIRIEGVSFEVKTATEDVHRNFQFNHVRYHREYQALLCVGVGPDTILFGAWSKAEVTTGAAGHLVTMDKGSSATFKLTKRIAQLHPIAEFEQRILDLVAELAS